MHDFSSSIYDKKVHAVVSRKYGKGKTFWSIYRIEAVETP